MKHLKSFEAFSQEDITDEGLREIGKAITKPFRQRTEQEIEADASKIINNSVKLAEIEELLKTRKNPLHYQNYQKVKQEFDKGNKMPFYKFILFVKDNLSEFENNNPMYYTINIKTGDIKDTRQMSYNTGVGGRSWGD
jgi:hypothetical protein